MITEDDKTLIKEIIMCFEEGSANPPYNQIYIYHDGPNDVRQLTLGWGLCQYDDFKALFEEYISLGGKYADNFKAYIPKLKLPSTVDDQNLKALLLTCAKDDSMFRTSMDVIFERKYWYPALKWFTDNGFTTTLSMCVIFDSYIHSGGILGFLRQKFQAKVPANAGNEKEWISQYIDVRYEWLATNDNKILRNTIYRPQFFKDQIAANNWVLLKPLVANSVRIS